MLRLSTTEKQDVAIGVLELETTQTIVRVLERFRKLYIARSEFGRQRIRVRNVKVSVPASDTFFDVSRVVRQWVYANVFKHDHRTASLNDPEEDIVRRWPLEGDLESKLV